MKKKVLDYIEAQTGMRLELCDYFTKIESFDGKPYFNVILKDRLSNSREMLELERLCANSSVIYDVHPNGLNRVAIVCYNNME